MKLNFWNWVHLLTPYLTALFIHLKVDENFLAWLFLSYLLTLIISMIPHMDRDVKTGRSVRTKNLTLDEYRTIDGNPIESQNKLNINLTHLAGLIAIILYAIYSIFSSM